MAMNVGPAGGDEDEVVSTINTTPLVDVMLVLLIIFLITIPVVTHVDSGRSCRRSATRSARPSPRTSCISVDAAGRIYWNDLQHPDHRRADRPAEEGRGADAAARSADPRRRRRATTTASGAIIYACQRAGIAKVGFITEPPPRGG